ncbi:MAG: hypothetical protein WA759_11665, partial [Pseudolabrys sp.]
CHGAETDLWNAGAIGFNHLHYNLRGTGFSDWGRRRVATDALSLRAQPTGFRAVGALSRDVAKKSQNIYSDFTRDNTLGGKLLATDLTLE